MRERVLALAALVAACAWGATTATAAPLDTTGTLGAAPYRLAAPDTWNGTLVVLAHGYRDRADHPGEVDDVSPDGGFTALIGALTAGGYAVASTAYSSNGWAVKDAVQDLTNLAAFARGQIGRPERTLLVGFSLGSLPTLDLAESRDGVFDGYLAACAVAAGSPRAWDNAAVGLLAWQTVFGSLPAAWGTVADGDDDVDFETEALPVLGGLLMNPLNFARFEFMRLITGTALSPGYYPGGLATNVFFITEARGELERRAGGPVAQNLTHTYALSAADRAYLGTLGVSGAQIDAWLATMSGTRFAAAPAQRNWIERYATFTGKLHAPVLTLHTVVDTLVPVQHERAYAETVAAAGDSDLLFQAYTTGTSHCGFSPVQVPLAIAQLDAWVRTGVRPSPAAFPAALGFVPGFVPAPWPQP
jgi:dienelactone hydrolase